MCWGVAPTQFLFPLTRPFETLDSEVTYRGRVLDVRQDRVRLPDGGTTKLDVVVHAGAVVVVPLDERGDLWFVRQYRHAVGASMLEFPAGTLDEREELEACAHRELREEIGMAPGRLEKLGAFYLAPGYSTERITVYLGTDLRPDPLQGDVDEFLAVEKIPVERAYALARTGELQDAKSVAALLLARSQLLDA